MKTFLRILIIAAILLILVFLSIGIVRVVPKALSSLASATVSIGSIFGGKSNATTTVTTATSTTNGFINTSTSTTATTTTTTTTSTSTTGVTTGYNNYVPRPGSNTGSYNGYTTGTTYATACPVNGTSNIVVSILSYGVINSAGQFVTTNTFTTSDMVSVRFKVENRGVCASGPWTLNVQMPAQNTADQVRNINGPALPAGSAVTGQANFNSPRAGSSVVTIVATDTSGKDPYAADNTASVTLAVVTGTNNGGGTIYPPVSGDGRPDLMVNVVQVGTLDYSNNFIPSSNQNFSRNSRVAVQFRVVNQGNAATGAWTFKAEVNDTYQPRVYQDPQSENSIPPGGSALYTVAFDNLSFGSHVMTFTADNYNQVNEFNEGNNTLGVNFYVNY